MTNTETQKTLITNAECATAQRLYDFMLVLRAAGAMPPDEDEYWERPWKWNTEYQAWLERGQPDYIDNEEAFARFVDEIS